MIRKLFPFGVRDPIRTIDGLLPHSDLHPVRSHRNYIVGEFLAEQKCDAGQSGAWGYHCAHHDDAHVFDECRITENFIR